MANDMSGWMTLRMDDVFRADGMDRDDAHQHLPLGRRHLEKQRMPPRIG